MHGRLELCPGAVTEYTSTNNTTTYWFLLMSSGARSWSMDVILGEREDFASSCSTGWPICLGTRIETSLCWQICGPHIFRSAENCYVFLPQKFGAVDAGKRIMGTWVTRTSCTSA